MNKFRFQDKIRLSFLFVFVVMMLVAIYIFLQIRTISEQTRLLYEHPYKVSNALRDIKSEIFMNHNSLINIGFADNDRQLDSIKAEIDHRDNVIREGFKIVSQNFLGSKALVDSAFFAYAELKTTVDKFYQLKKENKTERFQILLKSDALVKVGQTVFFLTNISDFAENKAETTFKKAIEIENNSIRISIFLIMFSGLLVIFFIWWLTRSITRPIKTFVNEANILLKKDEKAWIHADELIMGQTLAELKNAFLSIELKNLEIEFQKKQLTGINLNLEDKVMQRTSELSIANAELAMQYESSQHLAAIVESSDDAIISILLDGTVKSWNKAAGKMFDYTAEEAIGESIYLIVPPEYLHDEQTILNRMMKGDTVDHYETVHMKKSGEQFHVSLTVSPIKNSEGKITGVSKIIRDITQRKKAEEELSISLENLKLSNKDLEQFAYAANHDLQEPLRMISSYTQLLERKYKDKLDQDANEYIQFVVNGAIRMQKLLNDLLEFSKINSHAKLNEQIGISTTLGQAISNLHPLIAENTALITNDDLPVITADEIQIMRLFQNLIENAIKFKKKTELPKIHISCTRQDNMYHFSVADNGIGMEMQYHDRVFILFQRLHSLKDYPGTGIGLSICKRIVERHGGTIWFESTVNQGTTFYFTIPVKTSRS